MSKENSWALLRNNVHRNYIYIIDILLIHFSFFPLIPHALFSKFSFTPHKKMFPLIEMSEEKYKELWRKFSYIFIFSSNII